MTEQWRTAWVRYCGRLAEGDRLAYPAGHPVTWAAISSEPYPYPVFDPSERAKGTIHADV